MYIPLFIGFISSFFCIKALKPFAIRIQLVDKPNYRKQHQGEIPLVGGLAIFFGVTFTTLASLFLVDGINTELVFYYLLSSFIMVSVGVVDDKKDLSVRARIIGQLVACVVMFISGQKLASLGNLVGFGNIELSWLAYPFTVLAVLGAINAFNMVDGIDGLIGGLSVTSASALGILFYLNGSSILMLFSFMLASVLIPYLLFNMQLFGSKSKKIFMGDSGSMFIGLSIVWLLALGSQPEQAAFRPVTALWIIAVPLMDMAAIMIRRIRRGDSPFKPDREHLHHIFMRAGFSSRQTLLIMTLISIVFAAIGIIGEVFAIPDVVMLLLFLAVFVGYSYSLMRSWKVLTWYRERSVGIKVNAE
jgi:UDP-GlcNAc:undecaprenyl-phosphate GlcNAc-1-phosphate transferase